MRLQGDKFGPIYWAVIAAVVGISAIPCPSHAQFLYSSTTGVPYEQNFNSLTNSGSAFPTNSSANGMLGWHAIRSSTAFVPNIVRSDGSTGTGELYSFGSSAGLGSSDRALGSIGSNTLGGFVWAVQIRNDTGRDITEFTVGYTGEQWRYSGANAQTLEFSFGVFSSGTVPALGAGAPLGTGVNNFATLTGMAFESPEINNGTNFGGLDGNLSENRAIRTATVSATIPAGQYVWFRWNDVNHDGSDHGLATDDFSFAATQFQPVPAPPGAVSLGIGVTILSLGGVLRRRFPRRKPVRKQGSVKDIVQ